MAALKLVERRDIIIIKPMDRLDALALFANKLGGHDDRIDAVELIVAPLFRQQHTSLSGCLRYFVREYLRDRSSRAFATLKCSTLIAA